MIIARDGFRVRVSIMLCAILSVVAGAGIAADPLAHDLAILSVPPDSDSDRTAWYREARLGMFIHWGLFAVHSGVYKGESFDSGFGGGLPCLMMEKLQLPVAEYAEYAKQFNPQQFDADAWVQLAKEAGMKYLVFTAKHHEGFAMFKTQASSFNVVDASPYGRDIVAQIAAACRKHGIRFGIYYSHAMDWHHPGGGARGTGHWDAAQDGGFGEYMERVALPQVRELLTNYGPISTFFWDTPTGMRPERAARFAELLKLQPAIITNNRLLNHKQLNPYSGDYDTPEQFIPSTKAGSGRMFEVNMTMNGTWGFKKYDQNWKPADDIIKKVIDIASKGGNFLLNVGPTPEGLIPQPSVERLRTLGVWMRINGESIYGTEAGLFGRLPWGRSTTKGNTVYLHVFDWPRDGRLIVPGVKSRVQSAALLASKAPLTFRMDATNLVITVPETPPDIICSVIKLGFAGQPSIEPMLPEAGSDGVIELPASLSAVRNAYGANARLMGSGADSYIGDWKQPGTTLNWEFRVRRPGTFSVQVQAAVLQPSSVSLTCGTVKSKGKLEATNNLEDFRVAGLGTITIDTAGETTLDIGSQGDDWSSVRLRSVRLVPVP